MKRRSRYVRAKKVTNLTKVFLVIIGLVFIFALSTYWRNHQAVVNEQRQEELAKQKEYQLKINFINKVAADAKPINKQYGLFPSLTIAQAALESDFGRSGLASKYNNLFGVKGSDPANTKILETQEYVDGEWVTINDRFRVYNSYASSIEDHALLFVNGTTWNSNQYIDVLNASTVAEAAKALQKDGYATDPEYSEKLLNLINQYKLTKFD